MSNAKEQRDCPACYQAVHSTLCAQNTFVKATLVLKLLEQYNPCNLAVKDTTHYVTANLMTFSISINFKSSLINHSTLQIGFPVEPHTFKFSVDPPCVLEFALHILGRTESTDTGKSRSALPFGLGWLHA